MVEMLAKAGLTEIELASFVRPDFVPNMADGEAVVAGTNQLQGIHRMGLAINERGYDRLIASGLDSMATVVFTSESMSQSNSRMSVAQAIQVAQKLAVRASKDDVVLRIYISTAWVCPFEGIIPYETVLRVADKLIALDPYDLSLADTIGHASPHQVAELIAFLRRRIPIEKLSVHLHDTQALGLANAYAAIDAGVRTLDASFGGLGGCPFAPGATGNLATEDLVFLAHKLGFETEVDMEKVAEVTRFAEPLIGRRLGGRVARPKSEQFDCVM